MPGPEPKDAESEDTPKVEDGLVDGDKDPQADGNETLSPKEPSDPTQTKDVRTNSGPTPPTGDAGLQGSKQNPNVPSASNPTDEMLTGGAGDDLEATVNERRTGDESGDSKNRMEAENGVDLDELSDHTQTAQGNKYGVSRAAARGFRDAALKDAERLRKEADDAEAAAKEWDKQYQDLGGDDADADTDTTDED